MGDNAGNQLVTLGAVADSKAQALLFSQPSPALGHHGMTLVTTFDCAL